jgi:hypothetical protein
MKNMKLLYGGVAVLLLATGVVVYKAAFAPKATPAPVEEEEMIDSLAPADAAILVDVTKSKAKDNTVVLAVEGLGSKYTKVAYELSYETQGVVQGVTSQPVDVTGKDAFTRDDIYLGTCSRNVCRPHPGVTSVAVTLVFTDEAGVKTQFSKEYEL